MKALVFEITLEQPVFIARPAAGEENSCESYEFIPGATLRGALIGLYLAKHPGVDVSHDPTCRKWFFTGENCFLNAYPVSPGNHLRMLPKPLSWRMEKDEKGFDTFRIHDFAVEVIPGLKTPVLPSREFARYSGNGDVETLNVSRSLVPHNASIIRQVKKADKSFVFLYDVLAAGQKLSAAIIGQDVTDLKKELGLVDGLILFLGGSRSANYGRVRLDEVKEVDDWKEYEPASSPVAGRVILTLLSDAILMDDLGQPATNPDQLVGSKHLRSYQKTRLAGGFNRKWGLPLPQAAAMQAGSVFVYDATGVKPEVLQALVKSGMGERCVEGFGRVAVDWNTERQPLATTPSHPGRVVLKKELSASSNHLLHQMAERRLRSELEGKILELLERIEITHPPRNSQLSQVRQAAKEAAAKKELKPLTDRLTQMKRVARKQFERAHVKEEQRGEESLDEWLTLGLGEQFETNFWRLLKIEIPSMAGIKCDDPQILRSIQNEYIARFVEGLMRKILRANQGEQVAEEEE